MGLAAAVAAALWSKASSPTVTEPVAACSVLTRDEVSAAVGDLEEIAGSEVAGLPTCLWRAKNGRALTLTAAPGNQWAAALPATLREIENQVPAERAAAFDAFQAVAASTSLDSPDVGCRLYSSMVEALRGEPAGTTELVESVDSARGPAATATACVDGRFRQLTLFSGGTTRSAADEDAVRRLLASARSR